MASGNFDSTSRSLKDQALEKAREVEKTVDTHFMMDQLENALLMLTDMVIAMGVIGLKELSARPDWQPGELHRMEVFCGELRSRLLSLVSWDKYKRDANPAGVIEATRRGDTQGVDEAQWYGTKLKELEQVEARLEQLDEALGKDLSTVEGVITSFNKAFGKAPNAKTIYQNISQVAAGNETLHTLKLKDMAPPRKAGNPDR